MTGVAVLFAVGAIVAAIALVVPAARRTGVGPWHPAVAWLALEIVFFGIGSIVLALGDARTGPALYVGGAVLTFGLEIGRASCRERVYSSG